MTQLQTRLLQKKTRGRVYQFSLLKDKQFMAANSMWVCPRVVTLAQVQTICLADKPTSFSSSARKPMFPPRAYILSLGKNPRDKHAK